MSSSPAPAASRRAFLATVAAGVPLSAAGCIGGGLSEAGQRPLAANPVGDGLDDRPRLGAGRDETPITLVEFTDPSCSYCASFHANAFQEIRSEWVSEGEATVYTRFRPTVAEWGEQAMHGLLEVAERDPPLYWDLQAHYFEAQDGLSESTLPDVTEAALSDAAVDVDAVTAAIRESAHEEAIETDATAAEEAGVGGVPTTLVFVDGEFAGAVGDEDFAAFETAVESRE